MVCLYRGILAFRHIPSFAIDSIDFLSTQDTYNKRHQLKSFFEMIIWRKKNFDFSGAFQFLDKKG